MSVFHMFPWPLLQAIAIPVNQILESSLDSAGVQNLLDHVFLLVLHGYWQGRSRAMWEGISTKDFERDVEHRVALKGFWQLQSKYY